jgi:hypothetical protein
MGDAPRLHVEAEGAGEVPDAGHLVNLARPAALEAAITDCLEMLPAA